MSEMTAGMGNLTAHQRELLAEWLPDAELVHDHSWGLIGTTVLEMSHEGVRYIVKAGDGRDHHLARELRAHRLWVEPWVSQGRAPQLLRADDDAKLLLRQYVEGESAAGSTREYDPDIYHQAGMLLGHLHNQFSLENKEYEAEAKQKTLSWLDKPHRIAPDVVVRLRAEVESWPTVPVAVVPTHGDWQPRNWLVHEGIVSVIDFGRADLRPAVTDFTRLAPNSSAATRSSRLLSLTGMAAIPVSPMHGATPGSRRLLRPPYGHTRSAMNHSNTRAIE